MRMVIQMMIGKRNLVLRYQDPIVLLHHLEVDTITVVQSGVYGMKLNRCSLIAIMTHFQHILNVMHHIILLWRMLYHLYHQKFVLYVEQIRIV